MKEKRKSMLSIRDCYRELKESLAELLKIEREKTFSHNQLQKWISQLQDFSLECPCELLSYNIEDDSCYFYECGDLNSHCKKDCKECKVTCDYCERASHWIKIGFFAEELDHIHQTNMWRVLTCNYLIQNLQLLDERQNLINEEVKIIERLAKQINQGDL
jgi:hypothetical protein